MKNQGDIRQSIRAISDISKITRAMHLISTSKMRKAIDKKEANLMHFMRVRSTIKDILSHSSEVTHPYLEPEVEGITAYLVIASDKGLCGGYNHDVLNFALKEIKKNDRQYILTIGQQARVFFEHNGYIVDVDYLHISQDPRLSYARNVSANILELYNSKLIDEVYVIFTHFISTMKREPMMMKLLPIKQEDFSDVEVEMKYTQELEYHPSPSAVLDVLVPQYITGIVYGCMVQAFASEQCARALAMESATENANDMIGKLESQLNLVRQESITNEMAEIIGAMESESTR